MASVLELLLSKPIASFSAFVFWVMIFFMMLSPAVKSRVTQFIIPYNSIDGHQYLVGFDALRGLAALAVFVSHSWYFTFPVFRQIQLQMEAVEYIGNKAVVVFVMLCGYLIHRSLSYLHSIQELQFYLIRRFFRIYPLYFFSILCSLMLTTVYYKKQLSLLLSDVFMTKIFGSPNYSGNPVTWSLYCEVLFYLIAPAIAFGIPKKYRLFFMSVVFLVLTITDPMTERMHSLWKYFFLGIITFELANHLKFLKKNIPSSLFFITGIFFLIIDIKGPGYDVFHYLGLMPQCVFYYTLGLGLAVMMILLGLPHAQIISRFLENSPIKILGLISYSVYLLHPYYLAVNFPEFKTLSINYEFFKLQPPLPIWYFWTIFLPGMLPWALLSYLLIELPFIKFGKKLIKKQLIRAQLPTDKIFGFNPRKPVLEM